MPNTSNADDESLDEVTSESGVRNPPLVCNKETDFRENRYVPNSCIESAEFIIQALNSERCVTWSGAGDIRKPHVFAEFANTYINITTTEDAHNLIDENVESFPFNGVLPKKGEGLCLINKGADNKGRYNMHFGAVVKELINLRCTRNRPNVYEVYGVQISDMNELVNQKVGLAPLKTSTITNVNQFRGEEYPENQFVMGKLTIKRPNPNKKELTNMPRPAKKMKKS